MTPVAPQSTITDVNSLGALQEYVYEISGDFDESPVGGTQRCVDIIDHLCHCAASQRPVADPTVQWYLDALPDELRPVAAELYDGAVDALADDEVDIIEA